MKKVLILVAAACMIAGSADARPGRWQDQRSERFRSARPVDLGTVRIGFDRRGADSLRIGNDPRLGCNLTHVKLSALNDSVKIVAVDIEYQRADRFGRTTDTIDLNDNDDYGRNFDRRGRGEQGIYLAANESTGWLDLDDVQDGFPSGRCIRSIQIYGIDTPDRHRPEMGRYDGRGRRDGRRGYVDRDGGYHNRPALIKVEGLLLRQGGRTRPPQPTPPVRPNPPHVRPNPPIIVPERPISFELLGSTGLVGKSRAETRLINVGAQKGRFDGIRVQAQDDAFQVSSIQVVFGDQSQVTFAGFVLAEGQLRYLDFDSVGRGRGDRDRFISHVVVIGSGANLFGSNAQLLIYGGR